MNPDDWDQIAAIEINELAFSAIWYLVAETIGDAAYLRMTSEGEWSCFGRMVIPCGPDGHRDLPFASDQLIAPTCAPGALIGKIGGSSASRSDGTIFAVGSCCIIAVPEKTIGPLFVGINAPPRRETVLSKLKLTVSGARPA